MDETFLRLWKRDWLDSTSECGETLLTYTNYLVNQLSILSSRTWNHHFISDPTYNSVPNDVRIRKIKKTLKRNTSSLNINVKYSQRMWFLHSRLSYLCMENVLWSCDNPRWVFSAIVRFDVPPEPKKRFKKVCLYVVVFNVVWIQGSRNKCWNKGYSTVLLEIFTNLYLLKNVFEKI